MNNRSPTISPRRAGAGRLAGYALLSILLMFLDQRGGWLDGIRGGLQAVAYPIKVFLYSPIEGWLALGEIFAQRRNLQAENAILKQKVLELEIASMRRADLELETRQLRGLAASTDDVAERYLVGRVVAQDFSRQRRRVTLDQGSLNGVYVGQSVVAQGGLIGQTMRVGPFSSEVILLTDPEHAVPVEVQRTGVRMVATGTGRSDLLNLASLPLQVDIMQGDMLVSSGLGGIFPAGYPVAIVTRVTKSEESQLALVEARTVAGANRTRHMALIWFKRNHVAAPFASDTAPTSGEPLPSTSAGVSR